MKIGDLFGRLSGNVNSAGNTRSLGNVGKQEESKSDTVSDSGDKVTISATARRQAAVAGILDADEAATQSRVAELRGKVAAGDYQVSSHDIARAILADLEDK
ncbi:MAG: flagellar biosynthesis anti-sigma factor FlgM [bacterium]|nr:flagellar biosynthesis anti-sigma factor FlgM [bacterium]